MNAIIDLYLVSGFLGSGKTTFLKQLLEQLGGKRIGVIVNEFAEVGIDGKLLKKEDVTMVEINSGSIFCACLKGGFVKTLVAFLNQSIDVLFIEASGMADPSSMQQLLMQLSAILQMKPEINREYYYKGSVCLIDAARFLSFCDVFQPVLNQVRKSSLLLLNKIDEVSDEELQAVQNKLTEINPAAYILKTSFGSVPVELLESKINPEGALEGESGNTAANRPVTCVLQMKERYGLMKMREFALAMSEQVLRLKGFFLTQEEKLAHADCVGDYIKIDEIEMDASIAEYHEIVMIGRDNTDFEKELAKAWSISFPNQRLIYEKN